MADQKKKEQTEYVVLLLGLDGINWTELARVQASSQGAAKRQALAEQAPSGGTVVAIPTRSWEPEDLKPKLSFG